MSWIIVECGYPLKVLGPKNEVGRDCSSGVLPYGAEFSDLPRAITKAKSIAKSRKTQALYPPDFAEQKKAGDLQVINLQEYVAHLSEDVAKRFPGNINDNNDWHPRHKPFDAAKRLAALHGIDSPFIRWADDDEIEAVMGKKAAKHNLEKGTHHVWIGEQSGKRLCILSVRTYADDNDTSWQKAYPTAATDGINPWESETFQCSNSGGYITPSPEGNKIAEYPQERLALALSHPNLEIAEDRLAELSNLTLMKFEQLNSEIWNAAVAKGESKKLIRNHLSNENTKKSRRTHDGL